MEEKTRNLAEIKNEINTQIADKESFNSLLETTFKGLAPQTAKRAMLEGMIRGFKLVDFFEKNIYAIKFGDGYSLVTSIDYARKIGAKNGVVGVEAPVFETEQVASKESEGEFVTKIISCSVTVKKMINNYVGDFTATVFFDEYYQKGKTYNNKYTPSMWDKKPRTMIAKVAEMHALRKACPEHAAQLYVEEEMQKEVAIDITEEKDSAIEGEVEKWTAKLKEAKDLASMKKVWTRVPGEIKTKLKELKEQLTTSYGEDKAA